MEALKSRLAKMTKEARLSSDEWQALLRAIRANAPAAEIRAMSDACLLSPNELLAVAQALRQLPGLRKLALGAAAATKAWTAYCGKLDDLSARRGEATSDNERRAIDGEAATLRLAEPGLKHEWLATTLAAKQLTAIRQEFGFTD